MHLLLVLCALQDPIQDLDSKDPAIARRAFERVVRIGNEASLKEAAKQSERARQAISEIRAHKRFGDAYPPVRLINYQAESKPTMEAYNDLSKILGVPVRRSAVVGAPRESITLSIRDAYPLEALYRLADGVAGRWGRNSRSIAIMEGFAHSSSRSYFRHLTFVIEAFEESRKHDFIEGREASATLRITVRRDPKCRVIGFKGFRVLEVNDDLGKSLVPGKQTENVSYVEFDNLSARVFLKAPSQKAKLLTRVRGVFRILLPEGAESGKLPLTGDKTKLPLPNLTLKLDQVSEDHRSISVSAFAGDRNRELVPPEVEDFHLRGKDGRMLKASGRRTGRTGAWVLSLTFEPPDGFEPDALNVRYFKGVGEHDVPFDFRDVPIR